MTQNNRWSFGRLFDEIFREFHEMEMSMGEGISEGNPRNTFRTYGPYVYGYSVTLGRDGQPIVREFSNVNQEHRGEKQQDHTLTEPYTELIRDDKTRKAKILVELPGVKKEDIQVNADEKVVTINAKHSTREYNTELELPADVDPSTPTAKLTNGILELEFSAKEQKKGKSIRVD